MSRTNKFVRMGDLAETSNEPFKHYLQERAGMQKVPSIRSGINPLKFVQGSFSTVLTVKKCEHTMTGTTTEIAPRTVVE